MEQYIEKIILKEREYQSSVQFQNDTNNMEANVASRMDSSKSKHIIIVPGIYQQQSPRCCAYSCNGKGLVCFRDASVSVKSTDVRICIDTSRRVIYIVARRNFTKNSLFKP